MERWQTDTRLPQIVDALGVGDSHPALERLRAAAGGTPTPVWERLVGEPAVRSQRSRFSSGVEVIRHDDAVVAVILPLRPGRPVDLSAWIPGIDESATLDDLATAIGTRPRFAGISRPYFVLDGAYARADFTDDRGWTERGRLESIAVVAFDPRLSCRPDDDDCPRCADLLRRDGGAVDVEATVRALAEAVTAGSLVEDLHWVRLDDLLPLHASRLMPRVESQSRCTRCHRIVCLTLVRDGAPRFEYCAMDEARRHPLSAIPPIALWGDGARIAAAADSLQYVDHEPGAWFLVARNDELFIDARYVVTSMIDDSAVIRLDDAEVADYRARGRAAVAELARRIHDGSPREDDSPFHDRDLLRGADGPRWRDAVTAAIVNHTWIAQQRSGR